MMPLDGVRAPPTIRRAGASRYRASQIIRFVETLKPVATDILQSVARASASKPYTYARPSGPPLALAYAGHGTSPVSGSRHLAPSDLE